MKQHQKKICSLHIILSMAVFINGTICHGQCGPSLARSCASAVSQSFTGSKFGFSSPANAMTADNSYASATAMISVLTGPTENLVLTNFGFSIPSNAIICGVMAEVKKRAVNVNALSTVTDNSVKLVRSGVAAGNNKAIATNWTTTNSYFTYGGNADTWGLTLTPADINATGFGVAISATIAGTISLIPSAQIDHVQLTIYYTFALPVVLSDFKAHLERDRVILNWKSEKEERFSHYEIEKSVDGRNFSKMAIVLPALATRNYSFADNSPAITNFYRLKMVDVNGSFEYSKIVAAFLSKMFPVCSISVLPGGQCVLNLKNFKEGMYDLQVKNIGGMLVEKKTVSVVANNDIETLLLKETGFYLISFYQNGSLMATTVKVFIDR